MLKLEKMQKRIEKLLSVFTAIINELKKNIDELKGDIAINNAEIENLKYENKLMDEKISEYENLKGKLEGLFN